MGGRAFVIAVAAVLVLAGLAAFLYLSRGPSVRIEPPETHASDGIAWGEETDGIRCGISLGRERHALGEKVALAVFLRSSRSDEVTCTVSSSRIFSCKVGDDGVHTLFMVVDTAGGRHPWTSTRTCALPPGETVKVLTEDFATRGAPSGMSDIHFSPGKTRIRARCAPLFGQFSGPPPADEPEGVLSGEVTVEVTE